MDEIVTIVTSLAPAFAVLLTAAALLLYGLALLAAFFFPRTLGRRLKATFESSASWPSWPRCAR